MWLMLIVSFVFASPEPCEKYGGKEYDRCVDNLTSDSNVTVTEEDVKPEEERQCGASRTAEGMKGCLADARQAVRRAKEDSSVSRRLLRAKWLQTAQRQSVSPSR